MKLIIDIPKFTRCCFFLPLRRGILTFAYINLALSMLSVAATSCIIHRLGIKATAAAYRLSSFYGDAIFLFIVVLLDVVFDVVLIIGAHRKNVLLMEVFYYYEISTTLAAFVLSIGLMLTQYGMLVEGVVMVFLGTVVHSYMILLVRSEIVKLKPSSQPTNEYVNRLNNISQATNKYVNRVSEMSQPTNEYVNRISDMSQPTNEYVNRLSEIVVSNQPRQDTADS